MNRLTDRERGTYRETVIQRYSKRETGRRKDGQTESSADWLTEKERDPADKFVCRQTEIQTHRQRD